MRRRAASDRGPKRPTRDDVGCRARRGVVTGSPPSVACVETARLKTTQGLGRRLVLAASSVRRHRSSVASCSCRIRPSLPSDRDRSGSSGRVRLVSNIGTWMETVALGYYVADSTGSRQLVGSGCGRRLSCPARSSGPVGSAMADRFRRRRVLATGSTCCRATHRRRAWPVWVGTGGATPLGIAVGGVPRRVACPAFTFPSFQTTLPTLVPP
jgi:hypothetical protein